MSIRHEEYSDLMIYVQREQFPCNKVAAHPIGNPLVTQNEIRAGLAGYIFGKCRSTPADESSSCIKTSITPFHASQAGHYDEYSKILEEIVRREEALPSGFDPVIYAFIPKDGYNKQVLSKLDWELAFYFNLFRI